MTTKHLNILAFCDATIGAYSDIINRTVTRMLRLGQQQLGLLEMTNTKHENICVNLRREDEENQFVKDVVKFYRASSFVERQSFLDALISSTHYRQAPIS